MKMAAGTLTSRESLDEAYFTPVHALAKVSGGAALLVVGAREHEEFLSLPRGSVTHVLAHHAKCPVLIAR